MYMVDHGTLGQYFFNEDRWFWYFDIQPFLRIRISRTWEHLTVIQHQETLQLEDWSRYFGLRTSTWTRNDLCTNLQTCQIFPATCKVATQGYWEWRSPAALRKPGGSSSCHGCTACEVISSKADSHAAISKEPPLNGAGTNCPFWSSTLGYSCQENCQFFVLKSGCRLYPKTLNSYRH